jgi:uncharacterized protein YyaL (SSP411 family)
MSLIERKISKLISVNSSGKYHSLIRVKSYQNYPILKQFLPHILPLWMSSEDSNFPTTFGKQGAGNQYFICKNKTCSPPYEEIEGILAKI